MQFMVSSGTMDVDTTTIQISTSSLANVNADTRVTLEQAQKIISAHLCDSDQSATVISSFREVKSDSLYSNTSEIKSYRIDLPNVGPPTSYMLVVSFSTTSNSGYRINSIATIAHLHNLITSQSSIPLPILYKSDTSLSLIPFHYLLLSTLQSKSVTLSNARKSNILNPEDNTRIDLQLGLYLRQLHSIQNDWFGPPLSSRKQPMDPSYSWQESFTLLLESVLTELECRPANELGMDIPFEQIRRCLSRAIGFFLFDDVAAPSLVCFTLSDEDVLIALPPASQADEPRITSFPLPTYALWADPMLEMLFMPPGPSQALLEAYMDGSGPLIVFPRQRTKRVWYTLFLACVVLTEGAGKEERKVAWATNVIQECVDTLKDAPCY